MSKMASASVLAVLCLLVSAVAGQDAPGPAAAGPVNLTAILEKGGQFTRLIKLLEVTSVAEQIRNQLNSSTEGLTVLAPTDNAFSNLKAGTLNALSTQDQVNLILFHVLPKFYSLEDLLTVSNPVRTQYSVDGLNFTGQSRDLNVSSGLVQTRLNNPLRQQFPLAVYQLDDVLLPPSFYSPRPAPPPSTPATNNTAKTNSSAAASPSSDDDKSFSPRAATVPLSFLFALLASSFF